MDFIKRMKKREFLEMGLKALAAVLAAFLAIILMEGMIYGINLHALKTQGGNYTANTSSTIAYCIEQEDDKYLVLFYNEDVDNAGNREWSAASDLISREDCTAKKLSVKDVKFKAPNAFEFSIEGFHFVIMGVFVGLVIGLFVYRFIRLGKAYKKIEEEFNATGTIAFNN